MTDTPVREIAHLPTPAVEDAARTPIPEGYGGMKHADPSALSFGELRAMLGHGVENGQRHFVIVFHSFAAVKTANIAYSRLKRDWLTIGRLQRLLAYERAPGSLSSLHVRRSRTRRARRRGCPRTIARLAAAARGEPKIDAGAQSRRRAWRGRTK